MFREFRRWGELIIYNTFANYYRVRMTDRYERATIATRTTPANWSRDKRFVLTPHTTRTAGKGRWYVFRRFSLPDRTN